MRIIGLTGGIASGKSTVARMLAQRGAAIVDADQLAREVVEPGQPALDEIRERFGDGYIAADGALDREKLAALVFSNPEKRRVLEAITHPRIAALAQEKLAAHRESGVEVAIYEAALLIENGIHRALDATIVVAVPREVQIARLQKRDGLDAQEAEARLQSQLPLEEKTRQATYVVDNSGSVEETERRVEELWQALRSESQ